MPRPPGPRLTGFDGDPVATPIDVPVAMPIDVPVAMPIDVPVATPIDVPVGPAADGFWGAEFTGAPGAAWMFRRQLEAYDRLREDSPLGRVFATANRMHDSIDAVVVVADSDRLRTIDAAIATAADPFRNQRSRAERGGKPRYYVIDHRGDNDRMDGVLRCIGPSGAAVVSIDSVAHGDAVRRIADGLAECCGGRRIAVRFGSPDEAGDGGFVIDRELPPWRSMGSVATLLPMAMLALDCIRLLDGALKVVDDVASDAPVGDAATLLSLGALRLHSTVAAADPLCAWFNRGVRGPATKLSLIAEGRRCDPVRDAGGEAVSPEVAAHPMRLEVPLVDTQTAGEIAALAYMRSGAPRP